MNRQTKRKFTWDVVRITIVFLFSVLFNTLAAQDLQLNRVTSVNGRKVFEIRMGIVPRTNVLRTLVVTAGPIAGSTSLLVNTSLVGNLFNGSIPTTFSVVVNSGGIYSLGGGCSRAGELNFPYIDGTQFRLVRFTGTTQTIVSPPAFAAQYEGVNCVTSPDGLAVFYTVANRITSRIEIWREGAGNVFTRIHTGSNAIRLPFNGGLRPQISRIFRNPTAQVSGKLKNKGFVNPPYELNHVMSMFQDSDGVIEVRLIPVDTGIAEGNCTPIGSRSAGTPPFEAVLTPDYAVADFDGDGIAEVVSIRPIVGGSCEVGSRRINIGSAAGGNGFTRTGFGVAGDTESKLYRTINGANFFTFTTPNVSSAATPFAGRGGPFHAAFVSKSEFDDGIVAVGTGANNTNLEFFAFAPRFTGGVSVSSFEDPISGEKMSIEVAPSPAQ